VRDGRSRPYPRTTLTGGAKERIADFVHGDDGLGNTNQPPPVGKAVHGQTAAEFIVAKANEFPGKNPVTPPP
jgi:uridine nucleosidase